MKGAKKIKLITFGKNLSLPPMRGSHPGTLLSSGGILKVNNKKNLTIYFRRCRVADGEADGQSTDTPGPRE